MTTCSRFRGEGRRSDERGVAASERPPSERPSSERPSSRNELRVGADVLRLGDSASSPEAGPEPEPALWGRAGIATGAGREFDEPDVFRAALEASSSSSLFAASPGMNSSPHDFLRSPSPAPRGEDASGAPSAAIPRDEEGASLEAAAAAAARSRSSAAACAGLESSSLGSAKAAAAPAGSPWSRDLSPPEATASAETISPETEGVTPGDPPGEALVEPTRAPLGAAAGPVFADAFPARFSPTLVFFSAEGGAPSVVFKPTKSLRNSSSMTRGERASVETPRRARRRCARAGVTRLTNAKSVVPNPPLS